MKTFKWVPNTVSGHYEREICYVLGVQVFLDTHACSRGEGTCRWRWCFYTHHRLLSLLLPWTAVFDSEASQTQGMHTKLQVCTTINLTLILCNHWHSIFSPWTWPQETLKRGQVLQREREGPAHPGLGTVWEKCNQADHRLQQGSKVPFMFYL